MDLRVCFVGDSFVAGVGDPEHLGWVGRIAARTERSGQPLTAYNLGVRRETSAHISHRWLRESAPRLPMTSHRRAVVSFGVNDTTEEDGGPRLDPSESIANLQAVLRAADLADLPLLVVGPPPVVDERQNGRIAELDARFGEVCRAGGGAYVGVFDRLIGDPSWRREVAAGDGAHPGADGYRRLADLVWPTWCAWLGLIPP